MQPFTRIDLSIRSFRFSVYKNIKTQNCSICLSIHWTLIRPPTGASEVTTIRRYIPVLSLFFGTFGTRCSFVPGFSTSNSPRGSFHRRQPLHQQQVVELLQQLTATDVMRWGWYTRWRVLKRGLHGIYTVCRPTCRAGTLAGWHASANALQQSPSCLKKRLHCDYCATHNTAHITAIRPSVCACDWRSCCQ